MKCSCEDDKEGVLNRVNDESDFWPPDEYTVVIIYVVLNALQTHHLVKIHCRQLE